MGKLVLTDYDRTIVLDMETNHPDWENLKNALDEGDKNAAKELIKEIRESGAYKESKEEYLIVEVELV